MKKKVINMWEHIGWGDAINWNTFEERRIYGHLTYEFKPNKGDEIRAKMESGKVARFKVIEIEHCHDPHDMFFATLKDVGYV